MRMEPGGRLRWLRSIPEAMAAARAPRAGGLSERQIIHPAPIRHRSRLGSDQARNRRGIVAWRLGLAAGQVSDQSALTLERANAS